MARLAEDMGKLSAQDSDEHIWDTPIPRALEQGAALAWTHLQQVARQEEKERVLPRTSYDHRVYMATDAMNSQGAALTMAPPRSVTDEWTREWTQLEAGNSINWKETKTAVAYLEDRLQANTEFIVAVDNSVATWSLTKGVFSADDGLTEQIVRLMARCSSIGSSIRAMQIAGVRQPADELSRGRAHDLDKVASCVEMMRQSVDRLQWLRNLKSTPKRQQAIDEPDGSLTLARDAHIDQV
jgi:hypothetical protein